MLRKTLTWLALIIAAIWIISNPAEAAATAKHIVHAITTLADSL
jgi:hypothetical protein